jgi:hypothetical protein
MENGLIKSYGHFEPILKVAGQTSASLNNNSIAYPRKIDFGNLSKNLSAIQWWDQKLWSF